MTSTTPVTVDRMGLFFMKTITLTVTLITSTVVNISMLDMFGLSFVVCWFNTFIGSKWASKPGFDDFIPFTKFHFLVSQGHEGHSDWHKKAIKPESKTVKTTGSADWS